MLIRSGNLKVNGEKIPMDYVLKGHDFITYQYHAHEYPVIQTDIKILHDDKDFIVVNKPPSMPVGSKSIIMTIGSSFWKI